MGAQLELFETGKRSWRERVRYSIPAEARREVIRTLARMGAKAVQVAKDAKEEQRREIDHES